MDPKEKLKELEAKIVDKAIVKLSKMQKNQECGLFEKKCELNHISEMTKLAHQIRSLLG